MTSRDGDAYQELMCALAIVTGLKDQRAFPLVLRFADSEIANKLMGGYVTKLYSDMIARTFNGDMDALVRTITAEDTDEFAAEAILLALGMMRREDTLSKEDYEAFIDRIFAAKIDNDIIMTGTISSILEAGAQNLAYRIDEVADRGLLLDYVVGTARECKEELALGYFSHGFVDDDFREWMDEFFL